MELMKPMPTIDMSDYLIDIAPNTAYSKETNVVLDQISKSIRQYQKSYNELVGAYNKYLPADTPEDRADFKKSLNRIGKYVKRMHLIAKRKIEVYTQ